MADFDEYFRAALLDAVKGRGAQARLARDSGIGPSYINNIVKNRDSGSEATRRALAAALGFPGRRYEDFLDKGRALLASPPSDQTIFIGDKIPEDFFRVPFSENMRLAPGSGDFIPTTCEIQNSPVIIHGPTLGRSSSSGLQAYGVSEADMEPAIAKGGYVLVDLRQNDYRRLASGALYLVSGDFAEGEGRVRQLEWAGQEYDRVAVKAFDNRIQVLYLHPLNFRVLGRVLGSWRRFD
jgi:transcriptional regulator with XRE-family HTH domain